jgi:tetratricopeptide (TPR) repeat protein
LRGDHANPGIAPCIIKEVYFPPEAPTEVATLIESALVYQNTGNYNMAILCFENARKEWIELLIQEGHQPKKDETSPLKKEQEMFFILSIASVYESCGKDDLALYQYIKAKDLNLTPFNHPDIAFPYCGLGSVLYHMEEPTWALRLYLRAR